MATQPTHVHTVHPQVREHTRCRSCASPLLPILSLGPLYLSDFPHSAGTRRHSAVPLDLARCASPKCGLVQLTHTTPPDWMYSQYWYRSGVNETMVAELRDVVEQALRRVEVPKGTVVVDIGANDGTLLQQYPRLGHDRLTRVAYEPARNLYEVLRPHASVLFPEFFSVKAPWARGTLARIVTAIAMFYDLEDPHAFLDGIVNILHPEGVFVVQQAYLPAMLASTGVDNICHEHLEYYSLAAMDAVLAPHGLEVVDVDLRAINGGSIRTYIQFKDAATPSPKVAQYRAAEATLLGDPEHIFTEFRHRALAIRTQLQAVLAAYVEREAPVDLYAASTKSNTLLQFCGVDARVVRQAWERSPEKWGRYVGVSGIPIVSEEEGRKAPPAALLVGAWQWRDQFLVREAEYLRAGGRMILPLPVVEVVQEGEVA